MAKEIKLHRGDIEINLHDTSGKVATGQIHAPLTDEVMTVWRAMFSSQVAEFRQKSTLKSSLDYEVIFITANPGVDKAKLKLGLLSAAQTVIADHFVATARCR